MPDYSAEITALRAAIASGTTRVSYDGKSVEYDSFQNLRARLNYLVSLESGVARPAFGLASFSRDDGC